MRKLLVKQLRVITRSTKAASQIYSPFDGGGEHQSVGSISLFFNCAAVACYGVLMEISSRLLRDRV